MKLPLNKTIYNNKETIDLLNSSFSDIIKSKPRISTKQFFEAYKDLFYNIPKEGNRSHHDLINQSQDYLNDYKDEFADQILQLNDTIERLDATLANKQAVIKSEDPFYPNNTLLKFENEANPLPVYIMQNAGKRKITNGDTLQTIKKALGHSYDTPTDELCQKLDLNTLNAIPSLLPDISSDEDLNLFDFSTSTDNMSLLDVIDHTTSLVTCIEGKQDDLFDLYKPINSPGWQINGMGWQEGQNRPRKDYLGENNSLGCRIEKYNINLSNGEITSSSRRIYPGETIKIWYRNNPVINGQQINNFNKLHNVTGFIKEVRKTHSTRELLSEEYSIDEFGRVISNLTPHSGHYLSDINGEIRVQFYDIPQKDDIYE
jgi:hypothetical protein